MQEILVTGAAGFIGSAFVREALADGYKVTILDALTYAGRMRNIEDCLKPGLCEFVKGDIRDQALLRKLFAEKDWAGVVHFAAESHVDNSISGPKAFVDTNILGTFTMLEGAREYVQNKKPANFRFVHVSTDEVFGSLGPTGKFSETTAYAPNSPYSASKAASDLLVRAWFHTYKLPVITTNCSNNYGPRQFPEKLIPTMVHAALEGNPLPVYGEGKNIRDWIHVEDHARGVLLALKKGVPGETYCFGGNAERTNLELVKTLCKVMDELKPRADKQKHEVGIKFVTDRAGHDLRYAIDDTKAKTELGYQRRYATFEDGLSSTIKWYVEHPDWFNDAL